MDGDGGAHTAALPSEQVLRWVAGVVGGIRVVSIENASRSTHRPSGTFRLRFEGTSTAATDLILKVSVPRWITDGMVITNARALRLAESHGLAGPRLIAVTDLAVIRAVPVVLGLEVDDRHPVSSYPRFDCFEP
jgi:hypothetical protein